MITTDRRRFVAGIGALALASRAGAAPGGPVALIVGTYRAEGGGGLYPVRFDPQTDGWQIDAPIAAIANASFGAYSPRFGLHYLLDEGAQGRVSTVSGADGWRSRASSPTMGKDPCHAALDAGQSCLAVANYSSGSVALFRLDPATGIPMLPPTIRQNQGQGPNAARQAGPHAHWVGFSPDGRWLHSVDLGTDAILAYPFDAGAKTIGESRVAYHAPGGSGPRHIAFHPTLPMAYLVSELANSVTQLRSTGEGRFEALGILSTLRSDFAGHSQAAHIAINRAGTRLYVSNRGENSIAVFAIDRDGRLALLQHIASGGDWPRFLLLLETSDRVIVANERSGALVAFAIAPDGTLRTTGTALRVPGAVFLGRA